MAWRGMLAEELTGSDESAHQTAATATAFLSADQPALPHRQPHATVLLYFFLFFFFFFFLLFFKASIRHRPYLYPTLFFSSPRFCWFVVVSFV